MIKDTDFAYAAGYFDGDGCFHIGKYTSGGGTRYRAMAVINSTSLQNLQWFQTKFGGNLSSQGSCNPIGKQVQRLVIKGSILENFLIIKKFIIEKYEECVVFEEFIHNYDIFSKESAIARMRNTKELHNVIKSSIKEKLGPFRNTIVPQNTCYAYLAGFIDAECCLNIQKSHPKNRPNPTYKILLQCNNTKAPCFEWLIKRFGGQLHFIDRSDKSPPQRNQMTWRLSSDALFKILDKVHPFLIHKKPVCEELIRFQKTIVPLNGCISRNSSKFREFYQPILQEREQIFHNIQSLNKKGI